MQTLVSESKVDAVAAAGFFADDVVDDDSDDYRHDIDKFVGLFLPEFDFIQAHM